MHSDTETQKGLVRIEVHYKDASRPLVYESAHMTYVKDVFYCVASNGIEFKHPIANIWRIAESCVPELDKEKKDE